MTSINYLFPPEQVESLPTWRFIVHFRVPAEYDPASLARAIAGLRSAQWKIVTFPFGLDALRYDAASESIGVPIEVTEEQRRRPGSLADYESDFWKVCGHMAGAGFVGDIYYEAIDWAE